MLKLVIKREKRQTQYYTEDLGGGITLDMVLIQGGEFMMGTEEKEITRLCKEYEEDYFQAESPRHKVTVPRFFMGKYPITQEQWRAIAQRTDLQVNQNIELDVNPSQFQDPYEGIDGGKRPVEQVNWYEAVEFCQRLSKLTQRDYRLPSEAQWEYACRAGTTTAFHFGKTITTDYANYRGTDLEYEEKIYPGNYGKGPKGIFRQQTTPVGYFGVANAFGLYDMHGNVWELCEDDWHNNYEGAPNDGTAWTETRNSNSDNQSYSQENEDNTPNKVIHGGSWLNLPIECRCANRLNGLARDNDLNVGVRVVCAPPRT